MEELLKKLIEAINSRKIDTEITIFVDKKPAAKIKCNKETTQELKELQNHYKSFPIIHY